MNNIFCLDTVVHIYRLVFRGSHKALFIPPHSTMYNQTLLVRRPFVPLLTLKPESTSSIRIPRFSCTTVRLQISMHDYSSPRFAGTFATTSTMNTHTSAHLWRKLKSIQFIVKQVCSEDQTTNGKMFVQIYICSSPPLLKLLGMLLSEATPRGLGGLDSFMPKILPKVMFRWTFFFPNLSRLGRN